MQQNSKLLEETGKQIEAVRLVLEPLFLAAGYKRFAIKAYCFDRSVCHIGAVVERDKVYRSARVMTNNPQEDILTVLIDLLSNIETHETHNSKTSV